MPSVNQKELLNRYGNYNQSFEVLATQKEWRRWFAMFALQPFGGKMRTLSVLEIKTVSGGAAPKGTSVKLERLSPTIFSQSFNGFTTTVVCNTPPSFSLTLGLTTAGKIVNASTSAAWVGEAGCVITTLDTHDGSKTITDTTKHTTTVIDKNGKATVTVAMTDQSDSGISYMADAEGITLMELEDNDQGGSWSDDGFYPEPEQIA